MTEYGNGCLAELEEELNDLVKDWETDELLELLGECEFALSDCGGRIEQLKARGLKRLYNIITGINRKNKMRVMDDMHQIQKISLDIQQILKKRIDLVILALIRLNDKVNTEMFWTKDVIERLLRKLREIDIDVALLRWQNVVRNIRTKDNRKYIQVSDGMKVLLIVSDLFDFVHNRIDRIDAPYLETVLNNLELDEQISTAAFYGDIIREKECLRLYIKDKFDYEGGNVSEYGRTIYKINDFLLSDHVKLIAESGQTTPEDLCKKSFVKDKRSVKTIDLCWALLEDLGRLYSDCPIPAGERDRIETKRQSEEDSEPQTTLGIPHNSWDADKREGKDTSRKYSLLRLTPEGFWMFRDGGVISNRIEHEYDYSFSDEKMIKSYLDSNSPYMVTAPTGYFEKCIPEVKEFLLGETKYLPLADYYMYLWFKNKSAYVQKNRKVAIIEYYAHWLYVSGYEVNASGTGYRKGFSDLEIRYNRARGNIINDIRSKFEKNFSMVNGADILIFRTFTADKFIDKKLEAIGVKLVDDNWENILKTDSNTLGEIIHAMAGNNSNQQ